MRPILVIDDHPPLCELVDLILTSAGFDVLTAFDGPSGIELARAVQPAVILLDVTMPGMDGISTCLHLKREAVPPHIPMIGITGALDLGTIERAYGAGMGFFLAKPFGRESLVEVVNIGLKWAEPEMHHRIHPRFLVDLPVRCILWEEDETSWELVGRAGNASLVGMLLWLPELLDLGNVFRLHVKLPATTVAVTGTVTWQGDEADAGMIAHGVKLLGYTDDANFLQYRHFLSEIADKAHTGPAFPPTLAAAPPAPRE